ncbi:MAG TPA: carboxypeptidase-like regulatory domain-containing protein [Candidatus Tumulicola sp.]
MFLGLTQTGADDSTRVRGTVTGAENRPVPNALVIARSPSDVRETRADGLGRYVFLSLFPGVYSLSAYPSGTTAAGRHGQGALYWIDRSSADRASAGNRRIADCMDDAESLVELSAGIEYQANLDLVTRCP